MKRARMYVTTGVVLSTLVAATTLAPPANAATTTLTGAFGVSSAAIDNASGNVTSYQVKIPPSTSLVEQLGGSPYLEQFYYRVGSSGPLVAFSAIATQNTGSNPWTVTPTGASKVEMQNVAYSGTQALFDIDTTYQLSGRTLSITMSLTKDASNANAVNLSIFQLATLDLNSAATPHTNISVGQPGSTDTANVNDGVSTSFTEKADASLPTGAGDQTINSNTPFYQAGTGLLGTNADLTDAGTFSGNNGQFAFEWSSFNLGAAGGGVGTQAVLTYQETFDPLAANVPEPDTTVLSVLGLAALAGISAGRRTRRCTCPA
jgi:hypothetical protein